MYTTIQKSGLTLVELLVAVAVLSIIVALIVPRLRIASKERNIREAARLVGSAFSTARDRAIVEGGAGIVIERNPNFVSQANGDNVYFAGTRISQLRLKPPFTGDDQNDFAMFGTVTLGTGEEVIRGLIIQPIDHDPANERYIVAAGDLIKVNGSTYRIREVLSAINNVQFQVQTPGSFEPFCRTEYDANQTFNLLPFYLDWDNDQDSTNGLSLGAVDYVTGEPSPELTPGAGSNGPFMFNAINDTVHCDFSIKRLAVDRLTSNQSTSIDLPEGYVIDLRYSGPTDGSASTPGGVDGNDETHTVASLAAANQDDDFYVLFDEQGAISEFLYYYEDSSGSRVLARPFASQSLFLFINEYDPTAIIADVGQQAEALLSGEDNLWLTIGMNGGANIGYNVPPASAGVRSMISEARTLSRARTSARQ